MKRRESIKRLTVASAALVALPSWATSWTKSDVSISLTPFMEAETLTAVADTIIPNNGTVGALSVGVDKFLLKLISNCYDANVNSNVDTQLKNLNNWAQAAYTKSFAQCDQKQREELLLQMKASSEKAQNDFFNLIKSETIRGFSTSREVMVTYQKYKLVPGHFHGCVDVEA
jgi:hypothetical protein